jgi:hypothetical protein
MYSPTYSTLASHYLNYATTLRNTLLTATYTYPTAQAERIFEVLLMGIRLCVQQMGTPAQINELVDRRMDEMVVEERAYVSWPFEEYKAYGEYVEVEAEPDAGQRNDFEEGEEEDDIPDHLASPSARSRDSSFVSASSEFTDSNPSPAISDRSRRALSQLHPPHPTRGLYRSTHRLPPFSAHSLPSQTSTPSIYPPSTSSSPSPWSSLLTSLHETLSGYVAMYASGPRYSDYAPTVTLLEEAIELARERPGDVHPDDVWSEVERKMVEVRKGREEVGQGDQEEDGGEESMVEREGEGERRVPRLNAPMYVAYHRQGAPPEWRH